MSACMVDITFSGDPHELCIFESRKKIMRYRHPERGPGRQKPKPHEARMNQGRPELIRSGRGTGLV